MNKGLPHIKRHSSYSSNGNNPNLIQQNTLFLGAVGELKLVNGVHTGM